MSDNQSSKRTPKFYNYILNERLRDLLGNSRTADFADALGITSESVRQWTAGYSRPDMDKLAAIAEYFDCTTDYLLGLSDIKNVETQERNNAIIQELEAQIITHFKDTSIAERFADTIDSAARYDFLLANAVAHPDRAIDALEAYRYTICEMQNLYNICHEYNGSIAFEDVSAGAVIKGYISLMGKIVESRKLLIALVEYSTMLLLEAEANILTIRLPEEEAATLYLMHLALTNNFDMLLRDQAAELIGRYGQSAKEVKPNADT